MTTARRLFVSLSIALGIVSMVYVIRSMSQPASIGKDAQANSVTPSLPILFESPRFALTDQNGQSVTNESLRSQVWISDFIFTRCGGPCPVMSSKMAKLQQAIANPTLRFVSFSVDPERDTPAVLKEYASRYVTDQSRWLLLTGDRAALTDVASGMKIADKAAEGDQPIVHSTYFLLTDRNGSVRGVYGSSDEQAMARLVSDATSLAVAP